MRRDDEAATSADAHARRRPGPSPGSPRPAPSANDEGLVAIPRRVELFAAADTDADVVHDGVRPAVASSPVTDDEVLDEEVIGRGTEVRFDEVVSLPWPRI